MGEKTRESASSQLRLDPILKQNKIASNDIKNVSSSKNMARSWCLCQD